MAFSVPPLPYAFDALEPHIDAQTMEIHHDKHHATYVANANSLLEGTEFADSTVEDILTHLAKVPVDKRWPVRNNVGGHYNHTLFWEQLGPNKGGEPSGALADAINETFGNFGEFQSQFKASALGRFGSGWAWLIWDPDEELSIISYANQDAPVSDGKTPIVGIDVWEHAYYLKYQNRRPEYVDAFWNVVDWDKAAERFAAAS